MNRVLIKIGPISIYWYSVMIALGFLTAMIVCLKEVKRHKLDLEEYSNMVFNMVIFGILGARLYYVLFNLEYYLLYPSEILKIWHGGLAIHGGILTGIIVVYLYTKKHKMNFLKMLDISVVGVIIAQAIGRWGNFFNQEAFGKITTKAILVKQKIPKFIIDGMYIEGNYYQPTFLYESIWNILGFIILIILRKNKKIKVGYLTAFYLIWYSVGRGIIEYFRSDSLMLGNIKVAQLISIVLIIIGIIIIVISTKNKEVYNREAI